MITLGKERYIEVIQKEREGRGLTKAERATYKDAYRVASLIDAYGERAIIALSAYGVGPEGAARLLRMLRKDSKAFVIDIINAQKNFVRYKRFWK